MLYLSSFAKARWIIFGGMESSLLLLMIFSFYLTGFFLGGQGQFWLWQVAGIMLGLKAVMMVFSWKVLHAQIGPIRQ